MSGRNIKLPAVVNPESQFISSACYQDIFWNIFHINNLGVALTDIDGKMLLSNQDFITKVLEGSSPIDLSHYVGDLGTFHVLTPELREITVQSQNYVIKLCRMTLRESAAGAAYLWLASPEIDLRKNHQIITLKNLYRSFINSTFEFIFRTSTTDKLLFSNKHFIKSLGFENYRVAKTISVSELFQDAVVYTTLKQRIFTEKKITNETVHFKTRDGRRLVGLVNCQLHNDEKGKPVFNWTVLDISQRFEHEEDLKQKNEQLAKVNAQMEKFLYSTSHDLRSPLTSILGLVNLMRMELKDDN
ncbi:MAG: PAS domain S-box protein, partial [Bacteroidota bacterium]